MPRLPKTDRNKIFVTLRNKDPKTWSWAALAELDGVNRSMARKIYLKWNPVYKNEK